MACNGTLDPPQRMKESQTSPHCKKHVARYATVRENLASSNPVASLCLKLFNTSRGRSFEDERNTSGPLGFKWRSILKRLHPKLAGSTELHANHAEGNDSSQSFWLSKQSQRLQFSTVRFINLVIPSIWGWWLLDLFVRLLPELWSKSGIAIDKKLIW